MKLEKKMKKDKGTFLATLILQIQLLKNKLEKYKKKLITQKNPLSCVQYVSTLYNIFK